MAEKYDFDQTIDRRDSNSIKWQKYPDRDILPMWIADTDFAVLPQIQQAMRQRAEHPVFGYSTTPPRLVELLVERMQRLYQWQIDPDWLVFLPGIVGALYLACRAIGQPGDRVYLPSVVYPPFKTAPELNARRNQPIPMAQADQRFVIDMDWLERQPKSPGQLLLFCNPHNPGGTIYRRAELQRLADLVEQQDMILCSDEIHCDLLLDPDKRHIPIASLNSQIEQRSITLMAPSKTFNLAGLGCAFAIIPNARIRARMQLSPYIVPHVNVMGLAAAEAAYEYGTEWNRQQCAYLAANRDYLIRQIDRIAGLHLGPIEATYLAWIDISALGLDNPMAFFEDAGLGLSKGSDFGDENFMRLNFGCPHGRLETAVARLRRAIEAIA